MLLRSLLQKIPFSIPLNTTQLHQNGNVARCCFALVYAATHQPQEEPRTTKKVQHSGPYKKQQPAKRAKAMEIGKKMRAELLQKQGGEEKPEDGEKKKTKRRKPTENPKKSLQTVSKPELEEQHGKQRFANIDWKTNTDDKIKLLVSFDDFPTLFLNDTIL